MARILSQTLIRESQALIQDPPLSYGSSFFASRFINIRHRSKRPEKPQLLVVDLGPEEFGSGSGSGSGSDSELRRMQRIKEAMQALIIRKAAPDWIPFVPGSSYWIPPAAKRIPMTEEEELSLSSDRGWPSFSYFVEGVLPTVDTNPEKGSPKTDDEDNGLPFIDIISGTVTL